MKMKISIQHPHGSEISGVVTYTRSLSKALESIQGLTTSILASKNMSILAKWRAVGSCDLLLLNSNDLTLALFARIRSRKVAIKYHWPFWLSTIPNYSPLSLRSRIRDEIKYIQKTQMGIHRKVRAYARGVARLAVFVLVPIRIACSDFTARAVDMPGVMGVPNPFDLVGEVRRKPSEVDVRQFAFVGRLAPEKGVDIAIEALALLADPTVTLKIGGDGPERRKLEALATELGLSGQVSFLGRISQDQVSELLATSIALVYPARWEDPAPYPPLEAAARGTVTIGSRMGGLPETAGSSAWYFENEDSSGLATAMRDAIEDGGRQALERGASASILAYNRYGQQAAVRALFSALDLECDIDR